MGANLAGKQCFKVVRRLLKHVLPSAADHELGAELHQAPAHRFAEPAAAAGDQHAFAHEKIWLKHVFPLLSASVGHYGAICGISLAARDACPGTTSTASRAQGFPLRTTDGGLRRRILIALLVRQPAQNTSSHGMPMIT